MKQPGSDVHVFKLEYLENILNTDSKYVCLLHFMFSGELAKLAVTFADVDRFY